MRAKEYLQQLERLDILIEQKAGEIKELSSKLENIGGIDYSKEKIHTSPSPNASFVGILEQLDELKSEFDVCLVQKHTIIKQIQTLKNTVYVKLLYKHYVEHQSLKSIAVEIDYSYDSVKRLHGCALQEFEKIFQISKVNTQ